MAPPHPGRTRKRKRGAKDVKYRCVSQISGGKWVVNPRVGFGRVTGTYDDAASAAEAAAAAWNEPSICFVKPSCRKASRGWTKTEFNWIWQRGCQRYVLRRRLDSEDFVLCSTDLDELVAKAMLKWKLTMAEMKRSSTSRDPRRGHAAVSQDPRRRQPGSQVGPATQPSAGIPARIPADEDEVPATQPYPEDVLSVPEGTPKELLRQAEEHEDWNDELNATDINWGAAKFVVAAMAADPCMLPGDIADLEGRAAGCTLPTFRQPLPCNLFGRRFDSQIVCTEGRMIWLVVDSSSALSGNTPAAHNIETATRELGGAGAAAVVGAAIFVSGRCQCCSAVCSGDSGRPRAAASAEPPRHFCSLEIRSCSGRVGF